MPHEHLKQYENTGELKTLFTGYWMSLSMKINPAFALETPQKIWRWQVRSRITCYNKRPRSNVALKPSGSWQRWMNHIY